MKLLTRYLALPLAVLILLFAACGSEGTPGESGSSDTSVSPSPSPTLSAEEQLSQFIQPVLLTLSDLPAGWKQWYVDTEVSAVKPQERVCEPFDAPFAYSMVRLFSTGDGAATASTGEQFLVLAADDALTYLGQLRSSLASCNPPVEELPPLSVGDEEVEYRKSTADLEQFSYFIRRGRAVMFLTYVGTRPVDLAFVESLAKKMDAKFIAVVAAASPVPSGN